METTPFLHYLLRVFRRFCQDIAESLWWNVIAIVGAILAAILQAKYHLVKPEQTWLAAITNAVPSIVVLCSYLLFHAVRSPWNVHNETTAEHHRTLTRHQDIIAEKDKAIDAITAQYEAEREHSNLVGCPQMTLRYKRTTDYEEFYVHNSGTDGISVQLDRSESQNVVLTSELIHHVDSGANPPLMLHAVRKDCDKRFDGMAAWKEFAQDVWIAAHPDDESMSDFERANKWLDEMLRDQVVIPVKLSYADLSGRWYHSPARVVYSPMPDGTVVEVRPDPIMRK